MRFGIIAEGGEDQAVITNILQAFKIDSSDVVRIKPSLQIDETDKNNPENATIGTFQGVKNACEGNTLDSGDKKRPRFENAFNVSAIDYMIIHVDTAEIENHNFSFSRPQKQGNENYANELREQTITLIDNWLEQNYKNQLLYAVAIEEIEAWVLTIYEGRNSVQSADAKNRLNRVLKDTKNKNDFKKISEGFNKIKNLKLFAKRNQSLSLFVHSVEKAIKKA